MILPLKGKLVFTALAIVMIASAFFYTTIGVGSAYAGDDAVLGRALFKRMWVQAPASTQAADGLGPLFNARACAVCHKEGRKGTISRGKYPRLLFRLKKDPLYGSQFQPFGVTGVLGEGVIETTYLNIDYTLADGQIVSLRKPTYEVAKLNYGNMVDSSAISPRSAPSIRGVGLLESISDADILKNHDPMDSDGDGVSGRVNMVMDLQTGKLSIGRFGWKAIHPTVRQQNAGAFMGDLGISTPLFPKGFGECTDVQKKCMSMPSGNSVQYDNLELHGVLEQLLLTYVSTLKLDTQKKIGNVSVGKKLFNQVGCDACHKPTYKVAGKTISPYTDLLLHDMGDRLADKVEEGDAKGMEWKTPALWGNAKKTRKSKPYFLHDGRARNILEAILWHDGESIKSRTKFENLNDYQRKELLKFIESL